MEAAGKRLQQLGFHLGSHSWNKQDLQDLLDHDNHETREALKELMKEELFIP